MDDLLSEFLTETWESIEVVDAQLVELEKDPNNKEVLDNIFRLVHTIKGTCGFLGLPRLASVAHASENILGQFRDGTLTVSVEAVTVILESLDRIKDIMGVIEQTEAEPEGDDQELIARLDAIVTGGGAAQGEAEATAETEATEATEAAEQSAAAETDARSQGEEKSSDLRPGEASLEELEAAFNAAPGPEDGAGEDASSVTDDLYEAVGGDDGVAVMSHLFAKRLGTDPALSGLLAEGLKEKLHGLWVSLYKDQSESAETIARSLVSAKGFGAAQSETFIGIAESVFEEVGVDHAFADQAITLLKNISDPIIEASTQIAEAEAKEAGSASKGADAGGARSNQTIRVNIELLEDLMNMVSELVLTRNQLMQMVRNNEESEFTIPLQRLSQCTTELQESVMKTRMQPIGNAWAKLPRIVRDLSHSLDKKIELVMVGAETELDRQVLELIRDPLTHMVRNSADHGIEQPTERLALGKDETGIIKLNAYHEGGHIVIEISDDGRGLSAPKLRAIALKKGFVSAAELDEMSDAQIQRLIFHPGFSTAKKVTNVSGRGVGMDVVRTNIEQIGGTIDMASTEGKGSTFLIKIPLTLAIVSALIVQAASERFAIPQISVLELVRASANSDYTIEMIKETPVLRLRNTLLPLVHLRNVLGFSSDDDPAEISKESEPTIMVTQVGNFTFGICVDQVFDTEEIVVKPVAPILKGLDIYSGNTILGDGTVIMILDPNGIAALANSSVSQAEESGRDEDAAAATDNDNETMLVFRAGSRTPKAVPLALVARLEDFDTETIEQADGRTLVQYRGSLMPLELAGDRCRFKEEGRQPTIVFADGDRMMGLAVDEILDIIDDKLDVELGASSPGIIGSAIIDGAATEVLDVGYFLLQAFGEDSWGSGSNPNAGSGRAVLLVDDSAFFRNMIKPLLSAAGYNVTAVEGAEAALMLRDDGAEFDLIISDIEMPGMTGFEFAKVVKDEGPWTNVPLVALSSLTKEGDFQRGRAAGFNDYVAKFDRDSLLESLSQQLDLKGEAA